MALLTLQRTEIEVQILSLGSHGLKGSIYSANYARNAPQGAEIGNARITGKGRGYSNKNNNYKGGRKEPQNFSLARVTIIMETSDKDRVVIIETRLNLGTLTIVPCVGNKDHTIA